MFEKPFIAGASFVQISRPPRGRPDQNPRSRPRRRPIPENPRAPRACRRHRPRPRSSGQGQHDGRSSRTICSSPDNVASLSRHALRSLATVSTGIAKQESAIRRTLSELPGSDQRHPQELRQDERAPADQLTVMATVLVRQTQARARQCRVRRRANSPRPSPTRAHGSASLNNTGRPAQSPGGRHQGAGAPVHGDGSQRALARRPRAAPAHRQSQRAGGQARTAIRRASCSAASRDTRLNDSLRLGWLLGFVGDRLGGMSTAHRGRLASPPIFNKGVAQEYVRRRYAGGAVAARGRGAGGGGRISTPAASLSPDADLFGLLPGRRRGPTGHHSW